MYFLSTNTFHKHNKKSKKICIYVKKFYIINNIKFVKTKPILTKIWLITLDQTNYRLSNIRLIH